MTGRWGRARVGSDLFSEAAGPGQGVSAVHLACLKNNQKNNFGPMTLGTDCAKLCFGILEKMGPPLDDIKFHLPAVKEENT